MDYETRSDVRRARRTAADFTPNADYENALKWRDEDNPRWHALGNRGQIAVGLYAEQKATAAAYATDTTDPA